MSEKSFIDLYNNVLTKKIIKHKKLDNKESSFYNIYYDYNTNNRYYYTYMIFHITLEKLNFKIFIYMSKKISDLPITIIKLKNTYV